MMSQTEETKARQSALERHAQTVLTAVAVAVLAWVGISVTESREVNARLDERTAGMERTIARLERAIDGLKANFVTREEFNSLQGRVQTLERARGE